MKKFDITLSPGKSPNGKISAISSKSELHRLIFCACLSDSPCVINMTPSVSKDIEATISCFRNLGAEITADNGKIEIIRPINTKYIASALSQNTELFCGESGSTARFILPLVSVLCKNGITLTGAGKLPERPFSDLCSCLEKQGAVFSSHTMPIKIIKPVLPSGTFEISGNISSQYLSGLLFALPFCPGCKIKLTTSLESSGYVNMTIDAMKKFGVSVKCENGIYYSHGNYTSPEKIKAGGDWSNAAFFLCAAKENSPVTVTDIDPESLQPDIKIIDILTQCGFKITKTANSVTVCRPESNKVFPFDIDAGETPDLVPILCVLAGTICGDSIIRNVSRLKYKESDRIHAVCSMINSLGGNACTDEKTIFIKGKGFFYGGTVDSFNDHRIAMSAAIASCFCKNPVTVTDAGAVSKSYPRFFEDFKILCGN